MGYTLPVFACASAIAALQYLHQDLNLVENFVTVDLIKPSQQVKIPIEQVARINSQSALAITRSDPGEHLDITRNTPIWALVESKKKAALTLKGTATHKDTAPHKGKKDKCSRDNSRIEIKGGEGIGIEINNEEAPAIYSYAKQLITENLQPLLKDNETIIVGANQTPTIWLEV